MTVHDQAEQNSTESRVAPIVARVERETGRRRVPRSSLTPTQAVQLLRRNATYWDALRQQRDQSDHQQSSFLALLADSHFEGRRLSDFLAHNEDIDELRRVVGSDPTTQLIILSSREPKRLCESTSEIPGSRFLYSQDPVGDRGCHRLESVFFKPTPIWKRSFDVLIAGLAVLLLSPVLLVVSLMIKIGSPGPVIFKQQRLGSAGEPFTIWKFRTLRTDCTDRHQDYVNALSQNNSKLTKRNHDTALVPCGRFLRACCLDEIPQLFNVLAGSMSLVGPRPDVLGFEDYSSYQRRRFDVRPGMTGLWQVSGKNRTTFDDMIRFDVTYTRQRNLPLDLWILTRTLPALVTQYLEEETT